MKKLETLLTHYGPYNASEGGASARERKMSDQQKSERRYVCYFVLATFFSSNIMKCIE